MCLSEDGRMVLAQLGIELMKKELSSEPMKNKKNSFVKNNLSVQGIFFKKPLTQ